jgi:multidrug efflux pump subunit AcrA (membrane-fusion protein)
VAQNGELLTIVDLSTLELEGAVPSEQLGAVRVGLPVEFQVKGIPNRTFTGHISRINPSADPVTRQIEVFAEIPNPEQNNAQTLVEGLYAEGRLASVQRVGLAVLSAAIDRRMSQPAVVRVRNNIVERVPVTLGIVDDRNDRVEITSGVEAGDVLLVGASQQLAPGTRVDVAPAAFVTPRERGR